jgi:ATP-dependent Lon protease
MTGEITLRGEVLPIGGLKEKLLAAHRGGIATVVIPHDNEKDLAEMPKNIKDKLSIVPVRWIDEVLQMTLQTMPAPKTVDLPLSGDDTQNKQAETPDSGVRAH